MAGVLMAANACGFSTFGASATILACRRDDVLFDMRCSKISASHCQPVEIGTFGTKRICPPSTGDVPPADDPFASCYNRRCSFAGQSP